MWYIQGMKNDKSQIDSLANIFSGYCLCFARGARLLCDGTWSLIYVTWTRLDLSGTARGRNCAEMGMRLCNSYMLMRRAVILQL